MRTIGNIIQMSARGSLGYRMEDYICKSIRVSANTVVWKFVMESIQNTVEDSIWSSVRPTVIKSVRDFVNKDQKSC